MGDQKEYASGSFVVLISDFKENKPDSPIWKIDGKTLLQKFVPFEQDGKKLHKSTYTYSSWSKEKKKQYYAAPVTFKMQKRDESVVEFLRDQVKEVVAKSDDEAEEGEGEGEEEEEEVEDEEEEPEEEEEEEEKPKPKKKKK